MHPGSRVPEITVTQLKARIDASNAPRLIDIRETWEWEMGALPGAEHIAMEAILDREDDLEPDQEIVLYCRTGRRSANITLFLQREGFTKVANLAGGIYAWSDEIDPDFPKY
jgi:adenylyltransferase/sulfurtransferase